MKVYPIYKGLQKPLIYRGFKGKFIVYGVCSLAMGLVLGGISGALLNMYLGGIITVVSILSGMAYTFHKQKAGLHDKTHSRGVFIQALHLKRGYAKTGI